MADTNKLATDKPAIVDSNFTPVQPLAYLNKDNVVFDSAPLAQYVKTWRYPQTIFTIALSSVDDRATSIINT